MVRTMTLPKIGVNMTEAVVAEWLVREGDAIQEGDAVLSAETDKSTQDIYATESGIVEKLLVAVGDTVPCYAKILEFRDDAEAVPVGAESISPGAQASLALGAAAARGASPNGALPGDTAAGANPGATARGRIRVSPLAKSIAKTYGIELRALSPAAPGGRIVKSDVLAYIEKNHTIWDAQSGTGAQAAQAAQPPQAAQTAQLPPAPQLPQAAQRALPPAPLLESIPLSPTRKAIGSRLSESHIEKPVAALTTSVSAEALLALRKRYGELDLGKLSIDAFLARVVGVALRQHRAINSRLNGAAIELLADIHISVAVDTPRGLLVPVLRDADRLPLRELAAQLATLSREAIEGTLAPEALTGGSFTITNLGMFDIEQFTPVINPPECCILAVGAIQKQFVPDANDLPVVQRRFQLTLVFDHRIVDGAPAARFLQEVKRLIETPELLL